MRLVRVVSLLALIATPWQRSYRDYSQFADSPLAPLRRNHVPMGTQLPGILVSWNQVRRPGTAVLARACAEMGVAGVARRRIRARAGRAAHTSGENGCGRGHQPLLNRGGWSFAQLREALAHDAGLKQTLAER